MLLSKWMQGRNSLRKAPAAGSLISEDGVCRADPPINIGGLLVRMSTAGSCLVKDARKTFHKY